MRLYRGKLLKTVIVLLSIVVLTGCGKKGNLPQNTEAENGVLKSVYNDSWKSKGFQKPKVRDAKTVMDEANYYELSCEDMKDNVIDSTVDAFVYDYVSDQRITITSYWKSGKRHYLLEKMKPGQKKREQMQLFATDATIQGSVICLDCITMSDMVCLVEYNQQFTLIRIDGQGQILSKMDVTSAYTEKKVTENLGRNFWWCDEKGNQYILNSGRNVLNVFDASGKYLRTRECEKEETYSTAFHTPRGELILVLDDQNINETRLIWLNTDNDVTEVLATIPMSYLTHFQMQDNGTIIYSDSSFLWMWDVTTGERTALFNYLGSNILQERYDNVEYVVQTAEDTIHMYTKGDIQKGKLYTLSNAEQKTEDGIILLDLIGEAYVKNCTIEFNRDNPDSFITYKKTTGNKETEWAKLMGQFSQGKGPDLICFFPELVNIGALYDKGLLVDLRELVSEEQLELIFPGILAYGQINGEQIGLGFETATWLYVTSEKLWDKKRWSTEDILKLIEQDSTLEGILINSNGIKTSQSNLAFLLGDLKYSPFIDWEKGESHFDDSRFIKVLQYSLKYGNGKESASDVFELVKEGKYIATLLASYNEWEFFKVFDEYGYNYNILGRAGQQNWAGYLNSCYLIVVNKNTKHKEEVAEYLNFLLDEESKHHSSFRYSRMDVAEAKYRDSISYDLQDEEKLKYSTEFYMNTMKMVGPGILNQDDLVEMIQGEAKYYFDGQKSAEDVARIINNRVQIYLDERR